MALGAGCVPELDEVMGRPRALRALRRCTPAPEPCRVRLFRRTLKTRSLALEGAMAALALGAECAGEEAVLDHGKEYAPCDVAVVFDQVPPGSGGWGGDARMEFAFLCLFVVGAAVCFGLLRSCKSRSTRRAVSNQP